MIFFLYLKTFYPIKANYAKDMRVNGKIFMSEKSVEMPEGIDVSQEFSSLTMKGPKGELKRDFSHPKVHTRIEGNNVIFKSDDDRKKTIALLGTFSAHARNMIIGVTQGWDCRLKAVYSHFPMKVAVEGDKVVIQNFMGERNTRNSAIIGETKVNVKKDEIIVTGIDKEDAGQTAANIEQVTKVTKFDRRVFQDGIFITQKCQPIEEKQGKEEKQEK